MYEEIIWCKNGKQKEVMRKCHPKWNRAFAVVCTKEKWTKQTCFILVAAYLHELCTLHFTLFMIQRRVQMLYTYMKEKRSWWLGQKSTATISILFLFHFLGPEIGVYTYPKIHDEIGCNQLRCYRNAVQKYSIWTSPLCNSQKIIRKYKKAHLCFW